MIHFQRVPHTKPGEAYAAQALISVRIFRYLIEMTYVSELIKCEKFKTSEKLRSEIDADVLFITMRNSYAHDPAENMVMKNYFMFSSVLNGTQVCFRETHIFPSVPSFVSRV